MATNESTPLIRCRYPAGFLSVVAISVAALLVFGPVFARSLDAAKAAGQVAEQADGLLVVCPGAPASVSGTVRAVNAERLKQYRDIAAGTGASLSQVQARAGAKLRKSAPGGCK